MARRHADAVRLRSDGKTNDPATAAYRGNLAAMIARAKADLRFNCPYFFLTTAKQLKDFRQSWIRRARTPAMRRLLVHDLRRDATRNLIRAGGIEKVAMGSPTSKTRSTFDRYDITTVSTMCATRLRPFKPSSRASRPTRA